MCYYWFMDKTSPTTNASNHKETDMTDTIKTGDIVRSHDFDSREITGPRASYVIGTVTEVGEYSYTIDVHARVCANEPTEVFRPFVVEAPINGRPTMFGRTTDGVVKL